MRRNFPRSAIALGAVVVLVALLVVFWSWDWFIPLVEAQASSALGRRVTISHLHVHLARVTQVEVDGITIANPDGFPADSRFGTMDRLAVSLDVMAYIRNRAVVIPAIEADHPVIDVASLPDGRTNYAFGSGSKAGSSSGPAVQVGDLRIDDGHAHVVLPKMKSDFALDIATRDQGDGKPAQILVDAKGTYAGQPITGRLIGGALLSLRDPSNPYPIDLRVANGPTHVTMTGTVEDPLHFQGTRIKLDLAGPDMALLFPLTGIPIPETPPYSVAGNLDYQGGRIRFTDFAGRVGRSDLEGTIAVDPGTVRPQVDATLASRLVNLNDLGGFIGANPNKAEAAAAAKLPPARAREAGEGGGLLPTTPINVPKLNAADVKLHYKGAKIEGRSMPLDNLVADLTIENGAVALHPLSFGVGKGQITTNLDLTPEAQGQFHAKLDTDFRQVDISRLMSATHTFGGAGTIGGRAVLDATGTSVATLLGRGNGDLKLFATGGDLSALLVDLSGLQFGNALVAALGIPTRTQLRCLIADLPLRRGILSTQMLLIDTEQNNITGNGTVDFSRETVDYQLKTDPKHFSIGSLPAPIDIRGPLESPGILPDPKVLAERGGAAAVLGVLLTPLGALLPTIQLGLGEDNDCGKLIAEIGRTGTNKMSVHEIKAREGKR